jgi:hypothetical protein
MIRQNNNYHEQLKKMFPGKKYYTSEQIKNVET